jgi:hypothetical protein
LNRVAVAANQRVEYFNGVSFRESNSPLAQSLLGQIQASRFLADYDARLYDELYMPIVLKVSQGQVILAHVGTVPGHRMTSGQVPPLSEAQQTTLSGYYQSFFD